MTGTKSPLSVVVLTHNEELNIRQCLKSIVGWAGEVFVVDSFSTDKTVDVARDEGAEVFLHEFKGYADQRNWALSDLPLAHEWVLFLDADEAVSEELKKEIVGLGLASEKGVVGYYVKRRFIFMGRWIKHGGIYPTWILRLFRRTLARCDERGVDEHFLVNGPVGYLRNDLIHRNYRSISDWIEKHNRYATLEALEILKDEQARWQGERGGGVRPTGTMSAGDTAFWCSRAERRRRLRKKMWAKTPSLVRPFVYFFYRYFIRLGFLDGKEGFMLHFMQGLWYRLLIDIRLRELRRGGNH